MLLHAARRKARQTGMRPAVDLSWKALSYTQGNCATEGNSGNCQSGNCHSGERWMRKPSVHGGK